MMEIRDFAERVLFGETLEDKLCDPGAICDEFPGSQIVAPELPGRPANLRFALSHERESFPRRVDLLRGGHRGRVLHFFANHELLALEIMALVLLRFPQAEKEFRSGLVETMRDEQRHLGLYCDRMAECGVSLGDRPVNGFFWNAAADITTPLEFTARVGLTFEQANLDFAREFGALFHEIGDPKSAHIMEVIHRDETRHVRKGLQWFNVWRPEGESEWTAYRRLLGSALSPGFAKGRVFDREAREAAGLAKSFIDQLELYTRSRGRPPRLYWFNPDSEGEIAQNRTHSSSQGIVRDLEHDHSTLPLFLTSTQDLVLLQERPNPEFLVSLKDAGFHIPEIAVAHPMEPRNLAAGLKSRALGGLAPWGWSPRSEHLLSPLRSSLRPQQPEWLARGWSEDRKPIHGKAWGASCLREFLEGPGRAFVDEGWLCEDDVVGSVFHDAESVELEVMSITKSSWGHAVIKRNFGASGRAMIRVLEPHIEGNQRAFIERALAEDGEVVVEPWLNRQLDFSFQLKLWEGGECVCEGVTRFFTDARGQYQGSQVGPLSSGLDPELARFLNWRGEGKPRLSRLTRALTDHVGNALTSAGYRGAVGVDALIYLDPDDQLRIKPIVEINPRFTMGQVGLALTSHVVQKHPAHWVHFGVKDLAGGGSLAEFAETMASKAPVKTSRQGQKMLITSGLLPTTDLSRARRFGSLLAVGDGLRTLPELLPFTASWPGVRSLVRTLLLCVLLVLAACADSGQLYLVRDPLVQVEGHGLETQLLYGESVTVHERSAGRLRVEALEQPEFNHNDRWEGYPGWIPSKAVVLAEKTAWRKLLEAQGRPYLWGGRSPEAPDCSGLVNLAYRCTGIDIPRDAHEQSLRAVPIRADQLKPADLIFTFRPRTPDRVTRVMLYAGNGIIIEAERSGVRQVPFKTAVGISLPHLKAGKKRAGRVTFGRFVR